MESLTFEKIMGEYRHFSVSPENIQGNTIVLTGNEYKHIAKVLRMSVGDEIVIFDGSGYEYLCTIERIDKKEAVLDINEKRISEAETKTDITLFQGIAKSDKMEYIIQKATELGVKKLVPFESAFSVVKIEGKKERYERIALEAAKQCGRAKTMMVSELISFKEMTEKLADFDEVLFCYEREKDNTLLNAVSEIDRSVVKSIAVVIGSEGGFSPEEAEALTEKAKVVKLCNRILRTETASLFALSLLIAYLEE